MRDTLHGPVVVYPSGLMLRGWPLARKCLTVFGAAVVVIVVAALTVPFFRMASLVDAGQLDVSRHMAETWDRLGEQEHTVTPQDTSFVLPSQAAAATETRGGITARRLTVKQAIDGGDPSGFLERAVKSLSEDPATTEVQEARWQGTSREYQYARAVRVRTAEGSRLTAIIVLDRRSIDAFRLLLTNTAFLFASGSVVLVLALLAFYLITRSLILRPVNKLKVAAERVREGNLGIRSELTTGDEFQQLADTFNQMLSDLQSSQERLRAINTATEVKLHELTEANLSLFNAAKHKGEFLANVSHELRTPLNAILGFTDLLLETARADAAQADPPASVGKRVRYLENIQTAGKGLLTLINSLLEMARIEAGRIELLIERVSLREACDGLIGLISPLANKKGVQLTLDVAADVPIVETDAKKFQQIIFNFLSNAVKFVEVESRTGRTPQITLRVERLVGSGPDERVRVSVIDNGPGIPKEDLERIFDKFFQRDGGHTREHTGTGLGLAISRELAVLLGSEIQVVSEVGGGSMFSLIMPLIAPAQTPETPAASLSEARH